MMKSIPVWKQELSDGVHAARLASLYCCAPAETASEAARYAAVLDGLEKTIQFVTKGQTSSFVINDLLAQGSGSEVFYLTHRGAEEPTLLLVEADRSDLVKD